jgi:HK97 family phage major capsid protein
MAEIDLKDFDLESSNEPEVVKAVIKELQGIGEKSKANYEEIQKNYKKLQDTVSELKDAQDEDKFNKLAEDISTRQKALDDANTSFKNDFEKKIEELEVAFKRHGKYVPNEDEFLKEVDEFARSASAVRKDKSIKWNDVEQKLVSPDDYKKYKSAFMRFIRDPNAEKGLYPDELKALSVGIDPEGGYTVTPAMSNTIVTRLYESDPLRGLAATETISTDAIEWIVDWDQAGAGWEAEHVAGSETDTPQIYKKRIPVHIMYAKPRATQQLLEDSALNMESWIANHVARRFGRIEGASFVSGTGVSQPRGFLTYDNGTTYGTIEQVAMGHASALTADGFIDVKYSLVEPYLNSGTWLMNRTTVAAAMKLKNGAGDYIWKPGLAADAQSTILGLPVRMSTTMPTVAANALSVVLADWREAYMIVDRLGISIQRDPYTVKPFVEFYTRKRVGGDVVNFQAIKIGVIST